MDPVCPLLGLAGERRAVIDGADAAHRCHAEDPAVPIDRATQVQLCLTAAHGRCERFTAHLARRPGMTPGRSPAGDGFVSTRLLLAAQPPWRGVAGRARRSRSTVVVAGVAGAAVLGLAGVAVASSLAATPEVGETPTPEATIASETASATPSVSASPQPTTSVAAPSPTAEPTPPPTPTPPAPTPAPTVTYTVQAGDTLVGIARQFGTTVEALLAANDIEDPAQLRIGQVLVIP